METIVEQLHNKRLKKFNINIKTKYKVGDYLLEKNTNNSHNDNIIKGIILTKEYYQEKYLLYKTTNFDPRIEYTYINSNDTSGDIKCPNCGNIASASDYKEGCSYCGTYYNIDYTDKELGTKYHFDKTIHSNLYMKITFVVDFIISAIISFTYFYMTGRTFNIYDISKAIVGTLILGVGLYYIFYMLDALIIVLPIKLYKNYINKKQMAFWDKVNKMGVNKKTFFNNLNYELQHYYYSEKNSYVIDYDIIDYLDYKEFKHNNKQYIEVKTLVKVIYFIDNKIKEKQEKETFLLQKNELPLTPLKGGVNIISCYNCGASIDALRGTCEYCGTKNNFLQEWYLVK